MEKKYRLKQDIKGPRNNNSAGEIRTNSEWLALLGYQLWGDVNLDSAFPGWFEEVEEQNEWEWEPKPGELFWFITAQGQIYSDKYAAHLRYEETHSAFKTLEQAEYYQKHELAFRILFRFIQANGGSGEFNIYFNTIENKLIIDQGNYRYFPCFKNKESAEKAIKLFPEELKLLAGVSNV